MHRQAPDADQPAHGAVLLREVAPRLPCVACSRCHRRGRYRLDRLIARHGADAGVRVIVPELTADCPQRGSASIGERCDILFPGLRALFP